MIQSIVHTLRGWYRPLLVALFDRNVPWYLRWRTLLLQPVSLITYTIGTAPYVFSRPFTVEYLPVWADRSARSIVFKAPGGDDRALRPLHVEIHGGSFIGGLPESNAAFDERLARETGAVVVSITYRFAPEHVFPSAIDDVDDTIAWIQKHAAQRWGANPALMTVSGFSAGGNLAMAATQRENCAAPSPTAFKAAVTFYGALDLRPSPWQKPKPERMPKTDPLAVLLPLFDAYAAGARREHIDDARLSPALAKRETLPERVLLVIAAIDILQAEQLDFADRVNGEDERDGKEGRVQVMLEEEGFHGYLEVPDAVVGRKVKARAFDKAVGFLKETYGSYGWEW